MVDFIDALPPLTGGGSSSSVTIEVTTPLTILQGGTGALNPAEAAHNILNLTGSQPGDIWYRSSATAIARRPRGNDGQVLTLVGGLPNWADSAGGPGGGISALTGDVTASGTGTVAASVVQIQGRPVANTVPTDGYALVWNQAGGTWQPGQVSAPGGGISQIIAGTGLTGGTITTSGTIALDTATALSALGGAPLASPTFTGTPAAPTAAIGTKTTQLATTEFVDRDFMPLAGGASITLTVGSLVAEEITLDGTPMVPLAGGDPGEVVTKLADGSIAWAPPSAGLPAGGNPGDVLTKPNGAAAWARIGDPDGLVIGNPTGGSLGSGTINIEGEYYQDGAPFVSGSAGFTQSFTWTAGIDPDNVSIYINNSGEPLTIAAISAAVEVGAIGTIQVVRADAGDMLSAGDNITDPFDVDQAAGTVDLLNIVNDDLPVNWRLGLRTTGAWPGSIGVITAYLGPPRPPLITSSLAVSGTIGQAFSYQITTTAAATSFAANVPPPVGLTVNTATGLISGIPTVVGDTNVTISASNSAGTNTRTLVIRVLEEPTAWDQTRVGGTPGRIVFSNQFRTMRATGGTPYPGCLSKTTRPAGKYYVEVTVSSDYGWFGIADTTADLENYVSFTAASAGMWYEGGQGRIRLSLNIGGSWNNFGIGAGVIGMAFDVSGSGNNKMWARNVTTDGPWTGLSLMGGDPAGPTTSTNGIPIDLIGGGPYYLMASSGFSTDVTMNPGPTGIGSPPAGYSWWDG